MKERLDFSCALFGPDGSLIANAPHLPVHLGAMSDAVKFQVRYYGPHGPGASEGLHAGDVIASNHPQLAGGSHLPDITVTSPVFEGGRLAFFVASRGHHTDIGIQESCTLISVVHLRLSCSIKRVQDPSNRNPSGEELYPEDKEAGISELLMAPGKLAGTIPGISGTRCLADNLSDLRAQVAANQRGITLMHSLMEEFSPRVVHSYMGHIQATAEKAVRDMLRQFSLDQGLPEVGTVVAVDVMDDGSPIRLAVTIDRRGGTALFDFEGTGPEVYANHNAPPAVALSAVIYALRAMVDKDIPLNQGCLAPVTVRIPEACMLNPSPEAAVVGGNVLTSQRVTDVVLKAFQAAAASQGCMNNLTFGDEGLGYYETIAGGAGAGPGWHGRSGVHTHMTNTRITDPEILERRYPVVLRAFHLREGSGGNGQFKGGDGVVREIEALRPIRAGILSERRSTAPFGLMGGYAGTPGLNLLRRADSGRTVNIGGKASVSMAAGDLLIINTPGAGGCGRPQGQQDGRSISYMGAPDGMPNAKSGEQGVGGVVRGRDQGEEDSHLQRALQSKRQRTGGEEDGQKKVVLKGSVQEYAASQEGA
ncbi:Hydantoinase B/oxoprolinase-domain-containing protein [Dunaliella salina]|uniref:Hydantoinase B/oxoprolinase-domain-containing protein n=1 Tax=Dunaliella salina TaxID=3046 RepID=A0ABQ7H7S0_DUNSA|nr:Hydantoinase B/oxoprolinase-domain-containing protein [Dunaliella salina]|eukprot:KAF5842895.1 Hydantoinase B/oxoprolinase-domain-containing protein [Dunaliella salina]